MGGMTGNNHWSEGRWDDLCKQLCADFGPEDAAKIIQTIVYTIGGERITLPSIQDLERRERDRRICDYHRGSIAETAARFNVSENTARRALLRQRIIDRNRIKEDDYSP